MYHWKTKGLKTLSLLMTLAMVFSAFSLAAAEDWDLANIPDP